MTAPPRRSGQGRLLTGKEILANSMDETTFRNEVRRYAHGEGWWTMFVRKGMVGNGRFITATDPPGFPDLVLARDRELIFAELKKVGSYPKPHQRAVLETLGRCAEAVVWRPSDWDAIVARLARRARSRPDEPFGMESEATGRMTRGSL